jgi:hypothetical protein
VVAIPTVIGLPARWTALCDGKLVQKMGERPTYVERLLAVPLIAAHASTQPRLTHELLADRRNPELH